MLRNGHHNSREVVTAAGAVQVRQPRVNDKRVDPVTGERKRFASSILPAWSRKSPKVSEVLPLLYLHGLSTSDFAPALVQFLGTGHGLSAATINRLTEQWQAEAAAFSKRSLAGTDYVYVWVDGIHFKVRLEQDKICLLVMIGVRLDGTKELIALADGFRESAGSWADLLRNCKRRGMTAPVLAVGDGALGFWKALQDVFPDTCEQRRWCTRWRTCSPRCRNQPTQAPRPPLPTSTTPKTSSTPAKPRRPSRTTTARSSRSSAPSPPSDYGSVSRRDPAHELKASPWRSNSSNPPKPAGEKSTHRIWSPWSEPAPHSATANSTSTTTSTPEEAFAQVPEGMSFGGQHGSQRDRRVRVPIGTLTLRTLRIVGGDRQAGSRMPRDGR